MTQRPILEPALPAAATGLMPVTQLRLRALARRELLQRTFTGTFVYPVGWLVVAGVTGLLVDYPAPVLGMVGLLSVLVAVRVVLYRRALRDTTRPSTAGKGHLVLGVVSASLFSVSLGLGYLARGGDAGVAAGYVGMSAIVGGIAMVASTHRRLAQVWTFTAIAPSLLVFAVRADATAQLLALIFALYIPVLKRLIDQGHQAWWDAQIAAARLDEHSSRLARVSRHAGMAENATNVLHDVGNALSAVKVAAERLVAAGARHPAADLERMARLFERDADTLHAFLASDGPKLARFVGALSQASREHADAAAADARRLREGLRLIETIVRRQQDLAGELGGFEPCSVVELIDAAVGLSHAAQADLHVEHDAGVAAGTSVRVDRPRVLQVLVNLLENAYDATLEHGTRAITIRTHERADAVVIEVADNGIGISPALAERIFSRGFTTKAHGHGFGLHGSFALAQAMGGSLTFESAGLGCGAVFRLQLPVQAAVAA
ncbi:MAG: sensor histidine kinase [Nannocystaceae bacterium]|nr:sensor histidine kinase [Nannocystaceae bacterium]